MPISSFLDPGQWKSWEQDPSTRESLRLFTKRKPIDVTLTTPGTAQDIITVAPGVATVNLITNPSMETGDPPTGYTAVGSTLDSDATYVNYGSASLEVTPDNAAKGEGAYWEIGPWPKDMPLACSAYFRRGAAGAGNVRCELWASSVTTRSVGSISDVRFAIGNTVALGGAFVRGSVVSPAERFITILVISGASGTFQEDEVVTGGTSGATATIRKVGTVTGANTYLVCDGLSGTNFSCTTGVQATETITGGTSGVTATLRSIEKIVLNGQTVRLYFVTVTQSATAFYVDDCMAEALDHVTTYCDGSRGWLHWWDGTANASTSRRWVGLSSMRSMRLHATRDCFVAFDRAASNDTTLNAEDRGELIKAGTDFGEDHPIYLDSRISFINRYSGEQPQIYGSVDGV